MQHLLTINSVMNLSANIFLFVLVLGHKSSLCPIVGPTYFFWSMSHLVLRWDCQILGPILFNHVVENTSLFRFTVIENLGTIYDLLLEIFGDSTNMIEIFGIH